MCQYIIRGIVQFSGRTKQVSEDHLSNEEIEHGEHPQWQDFGHQIKIENEETKRIFTAEYASKITGTNGS